MTRAAFRQSDVTRAIRAAKAAGVAVAAVEVTRDGTIRVLPGQAQKPDDAADPFAFVEMKR